MQKFIAIIWLALLACANVAQPLAVSEPQFNYATTYTRLGMHRALIAYEQPQTVADLYKLLRLGQVREVAEPQTGYGALFEVWDYYVEDYIIGFYEEPPIYEDSQNATNAKCSFVLYTMLEGEPEFGSDSKHLLLDVDCSKWYVFAEEQYNQVLDLLDNSETNTLFDVSA